jgi:tellurite resistance protein TehA-like permease
MYTGVPALELFGTTVFYFNICLFSILVICMITRFSLYPDLFLVSITHQRERLFVGAFLLSLATIISGATHHAEFKQLGTWFSHLYQGSSFGYILAPMFSRACYSTTFYLSTVALIAWQQDIYMLSRNQALVLLGPSAFPYYFMVFLRSGKKSRLTIH